MGTDTETQEIYPDGDGSHVLKQGLEHVNHLVRCGYYFWGYFFPCSNTEK